MTPDAPAFALMRDKARAMFSYNPTSLAGHAVGAVVVELVFARAAPASLRWNWGLAMAVLIALRTGLAWHLARHEAQTPEALEAQRRLWIVGTLASAAMWGWAAWSFLPFGGALQQIALILVVYTFCVASIPILAPQFGLYLAFNGLVYLPAIARVALQEGATGLQAAFVMAVAVAMTLLLGRNYRDAFERVSLLRWEAEALAEQLRAEKEIAEAARRQAEVANRAKTQFFAAASHDLRQPLHAMGLFAEALRQRSHDAEVARLVNSINDSVDALESLFSELLDVTRIDSGGVEVKPVDFAIGDVFRRLRLHFEPAAFDKGLDLRFHGTQRRVHADPLIVERILRNLVANAIRYTADGGVLVACRRRGDGRLALQVWDTGPGIADAEQTRIFEEFYQAPSAAAPTAEQRRGLGLGLAIVRRLAILIGCDVQLRSVPGRGSVFGVVLAAAHAAAPAPARVPATALPGLTLAGRTIWIVEDDAAVRSGLEVLLQGWGAEVRSLGSMAAVLRAVYVDDAHPGPPPELLIVDYRLEGGHTGLEALAALRAAHGAGVPAIVVTGSTMTGLDAEAERENFHLMVKPVVPARLRSMIGFKLGMRSAGAAAQDGDRR